MHLAVGPLLGVRLGSRGDAAVWALVGQKLSGVFVVVEEAVVIVVSICIVFVDELSE